METVRRELVSQTAADIWEYLYKNYSVDVDIPDMQSIIDANIGWTIDSSYELDEIVDTQNQKE